VKDIYHVVWLFCEGFEEELMALLTVIEASRSHMDSASISEWANRDNRELKRLDCSIKYVTMSSKIKSPNLNQNSLLKIKFN
jgi:hypothetical protein